MCFNHKVELGYVEHGIWRIPAIYNGFSFPFDLICLNKLLDITNPRYIEPIIFFLFSLSVRYSGVRLYFEVLWYFIIRRLRSATIDAETVANLNKSSKTKAIFLTGKTMSFRTWSCDIINYFAAFSSWPCGHCPVPGIKVPEISLEDHQSSKEQVYLFHEKNLESWFMARNLFKTVQSLYMLQEIWVERLFTNQKAGFLPTGSEWNWSSSICWILKQVGAFLQPYCWSFSYTKYLCYRSCSNWKFTLIKTTEKSHRSWFAIFCVIVYWKFTVLLYSIKSLQKNNPVLSVLIVYW